MVYIELAYVEFLAESYSFVVVVVFIFFSSSSVPDKICLYVSTKTNIILLRINGGPVSIKRILFVMASLISDKSTIPSL